MIDNITSSRSLGFLLWFRKFYGQECSDTFAKIADNYKQCNYGTVRVYLIELERQGYIKVENRAKRTQRFILIEDKFQTLL